MRSDAENTTRRRPGAPGAPETEGEERLTEALLEETPEGRGPSRRIVHAEVIFVWIAALTALVALVAITLATKPSYSTMLTIALLGLGYVVVSPVIVASILRRRDAVEAHDRAHDMVERGSHEAVRARPTYGGDHPG